ncbi:MAG TPA: ABC transporter substrate-binding protein, partial [Pseudonocardia sp.]|nr:ABC transporter substrate-binding protein [Pseudonocardia sp.]
MAGCGTPERPAGIGYWAAFSDQSQRDYFQRAMVDAFPSPGKAVMTVKPTASIDQLTQTALAAGTGPDLVQTDGPAQVAAYAAAGYLHPLDDYARAYGWDRLLAPWALAASRINGALVALPADYETMIMLYNPATLHEHGWPVPRDRATFEAICTEAKARGLIPVGAGNADWRAASEWWVTMALNHYAGPEAVHQALLGRLRWSSPVFVDAITLLSGYYQAGWWGGSIEDYFTNSFPQMYAALAAGDAAFMITGSWALSEILPYFGEPAGNTATWDWAPLFPLRPGVPDLVWDLGIGRSLAINARTDRPDATAAYLNFLESDPRRQALAQHSLDGVLPGRADGEGPVRRVRADPDPEGPPAAAGDLLRALHRRQRRDLRDLEEPALAEPRH